MLTHIYLSSCIVSWLHKTNERDLFWAYVLIKNISDKRLCNKILKRMTSVCICTYSWKETLYLSKLFAIKKGFVTETEDEYSVYVHVIEKKLFSIWSYIYPAVKLVTDIFIKYEYLF